MTLDDASCLTYNPQYWDTVTRDGHTSRLGRVIIGSRYIPRAKVIAFAKMVCKTCPVAGLCLELGMKEEEGIWGGTLPDERLRMTRS